MIIHSSKEPCTWVYRETFFAEYWETSCGNEHQFMDGTPKDNGYKHCPYCGKRILEIGDTNDIADQQTIAP